MSKNTLASSLSRHSFNDGGSLGAGGTCKSVIGHCQSEIPLPRTRLVPRLVAPKFQRRRNSENRNPSCPAEVRRRRACPAMVLTTADTVTALSRRSLAKADLISPTVFTLSTAKSLGLLEHLKNTGAIQSGDFSVCSTRVPRVVAGVPPGTACQPRSSDTSPTPKLTVESKSPVANPSW